MLGADGSVRCWGDNADGQLGDGTTTGSSTPVPTTGITGAAEVAAGANHTCAVLDDGTGRCWGGGALGQLGRGTTVGSTAPVVVSGLAGAAQITAGQSYTCATLSGGAGRCWGNNIFFTVGDLSRVNRLSPTAVAGLTTITHLSASTSVATNEGQHTCALLADQTVRCWGAGGSGQLSDGGEDVARKTTNRPMVREG